MQRHSMFTGLCIVLLSSRLTAHFMKEKDWIKEEEKASLSQEQKTMVDFKIAAPAVCPPVHINVFFSDEITDHEKQQRLD